jgi:hypothetical protein
MARSRVAGTVNRTVAILSGILAAPPEALDELRRAVMQRGGRCHRSAT